MILGSIYGSMNALATLGLRWVFRDDVVGGKKPVSVGKRYVIFQNGLIAVRTAAQVPGCGGCEDDGDR